MNPMFGDLIVDVDLPQADARAGRAELRGDNMNRTTIVTGSLSEIEQIWNAMIETANRIHADRFFYQAALPAEGRAIQNSNAVINTILIESLLQFPPSSFVAPGSNTFLGADGRAYPMNPVT
jgi:hypothetical protein